MFPRWQVGGLFAGAFLDPGKSSHHRGEASRGARTGLCSKLDFGAPLRISPDGKRIVYLASPEPPENPSSPSASNPFQLKVIPSDGGADLYKFDWPASASAPRWAPAGDAVEYALTRNGVSNVWRQKLRGGPPKQITNFESGLIFDFAWSRDGRQLALTRGSESSDVILIRL